MSTTAQAARPHYQFDAFRAQRELRERMADYLLDAFNIRHPELAARLRRNWTESGAQSERLFAPMLIQGAFPFRPDKTVAELQSPSVAEPDPERPLHPRTVEILRTAGMRYPLYEHQVSTLRAAAQGKTVVLSAGTGSGKTEAFLIPLLDRLFWDYERGLDDLSQPGVRALIIYPLNALVNNQIERIRELLCRQQEISFAYYTARLKDSRTAAENSYHYAGRELPPECQIIDRQSLRVALRRRRWLGRKAECQIIDRQSLRGLGDARRSRQGPPHILVTNFAMLEYMLIRPQDHGIFAHIHQNGRPRLRAIVLDEAHVYGGAQAAEIHMLLRRAALRFGTRLQHIQGYATSATLGSGDDEGELRRFAAKMFSAPEREVAAVTGRRHLPVEGGHVRAELGPLRTPDEPLAGSALVPADLHTLHFDDDGRPTALVRDEALARKAAGACVALGLAESAEVEPLVTAAEGQPARLLHHVISRHPRLVALRQWLFEGRDDSDQARHEARYLDEVVRRLFPDQGEAPGDAAERTTYALLQLGSLARLSVDRHPYIPTRMHLFVRTPAGVWVDPRPGPDSSPAWPWGAVTSQPRAGFDEEQPWLRLYLCRACGEPLLRAWQKPDGWGDTSFAATASPGAAMVLVSPDATSQHRLPDAWGGLPVRAMQLGVSDPAAGAPAAYQSCRCPRCDGPVAELDQLEDLQLAARSALPALVDAIYPSLGEVAQGRGEAPLPGGGRRLLTFSDSRQGAARVAAEVERTHDIGVNRQLLWHLLEDADQPVSFEELREALARHPLLAQRAEASALEGEEDEDERETFLDKLAQVSIYEALSMPPVRVNTLESLGLVEVCYPGLARVEVPAELRDMLSQEAWIALLATVLDDARRRGAIAKPSGLDDKYGSLRELLPYSRMGKVLTFTGGLAEIERGEPASESSESSDASGRGDRRIALCPLTRPEQSRMRDFVTRLCRRHGLGVDPVSVLRAVWDALEKLVDQRCRWLKRESAGAEPGIHIDLRKLAFLPHAGGPPFLAPITGRVYFRSVMDVSPELGNDRPLRPMSPEDRAQWAQRHSVRRVREHALLGLWSVEHTAQLDVDQLERQERQFKRGQRNLMASSTTMEMGVDLGGLTLVMLTNVPPGPANYWQRAGRAGRRTDGSSMVLTLAQPRPHDQRVFVAPRAFLERSIVPPQVRLDTRALLLRHVHAYLLAEYYRAVVKPGKHGNPMRAFGSVGEFMLHEVGERLAMEVSDELVALLAVEARENLADVFLRWLDIVALDERREATVREVLLAGTCLATEPLDALARACKRAFEPALLRARRERDVLKQREQDEMARGEGKRDESYLRLLARQQRVLEREALLSCLVRNDFLPRFGFPVDVVKLDTTWKRPERDAPKPHPDEDGHALRMERGLDLALAEYAPGGDVIAKKRVHRVAGLDRSWLNEEAGMAMNRYYSECNVCHYVTFGDAVEPRECEACKHPTESERSFVERSKQDTHRSKRDAGQEGTGDASPLSAGIRPPSPVRRYLEPVGFAVKLGRSPRRVVGRIRRMPTPRVTIGPGNATPSELIAGILAMGFTPGSPLFIRSEGNYPRFVQPADIAMRMAGYGYRICKWCGLAEPENAWNEKRPPAGYDAHDLLRGLKPCPHGRQWWDHAVLGIRQGVDAYRVRLGGDLAPATTSHTEAERFHLSLAVCLRQVAADMLAIDPRTLQPAVAAYWDDEGGTGLEAVIYDASGSGLLAHLDESPLELMRRIGELLEARELAEFVQFDTQFLIEQGVLDIPWLRRHFIEDPARHARIMRGSALFEQEDSSPLRGQTLRMAAQGLIEDGLQEIALQAASIDDTAFEPGQVLRALWARAIRGAGPVRLLIGELPVTHSDPARLLLASRLAQLIEHGIEVRRCAPAVAPLDEDCWSVLASTPRGLRTLGGMRSEGERLRAWTGPAFGRAWLEGGIAVENRSSAAAELAWEQFEARWREGEPVTAEMLRPHTENRQWVLVINGGDASAQATDIAVILQERTGLGPLRELGEVTELVYSDRYVGRSAVAVWMLARLLALFTYAGGARGKVRCLEARNDSLPVDGSVEKIFRRRTPPDNLDRDAASLFRKWCEQESKKQGLDLRFHHGKEKDIGHQRRLQVAFAPGGRVSSMVVLFDHGLDWVRPVSGNDTRPWTEQRMAAEASHIIVLLDPDRGH